LGFKVPRDPEFQKISIWDLKFVGNPEFGKMGNKELES